MLVAGVENGRPELRQVVAEASQALSTLDADRLEELALSCQALNRELEPMPESRRLALAREARAALGDMAVFARILDATEANLRVMKRLRDLRMGEVEYSTEPDSAWREGKRESAYGHH